MTHTQQEQPSADSLTVVRRSWRNRARTAVVAAVVLVMALSGCASIPTSGPVGKSTPIAAEKDHPNIELQQYGPEENVSPENLIKGFIDTGTGVDNDFQKAREFLTPPLALTWSPSKRIMIYKSYTISQGPGTDTFKITFQMVSTVDSSGLQTPAVANAVENVEMSVAKVEGQWRIDKAPDGIMLRQGYFRTLYTPVSLYFYDPTFAYAVPDVRWFPRRNTKTVTAIVQAMLLGPAPYLQGAVVSAFPAGIGLDLDTVPVEGSIANVALTSSLLLGTKVLQRQQMQAQLLLTLRKALDNVTGVQFMADNRPVEMGPPSALVNSLIVDDVVPSKQVALSKDHLVNFDGAKIAEIPGLDSVAALAPEAPAISYSGNAYGFLSEEGNKLYEVMPGQLPVVAATGQELTPPSFAPNGTLWTASGDESGTVQIFDVSSKSQASSFVVPWLVGASVTTLKISRDGTRALVIYAKDGVTHVALTGLVRTDQNIRGLSEPMALTTELKPTLGVWVGETSVAILDTSNESKDSIQVLDLTTDPTTLSPLGGVTWISSGDRDHNVYAQTDSQIFHNASNAWVPIFKGISQASFAG